MKLSIGLSTLAVVASVAANEITVASTLTDLNNKLVTISTEAAASLAKLDATNFAIVNPQVMASMDQMNAATKDALATMANKVKSKRSIDISFEKRSDVTAAVAMKNVVNTYSNFAQKMNDATTANKAFTATANQYGQKFLAGLSNIFIVNGGGGILGGLGVAINGNGAGAAAANASGEGFLGLGCLCNAYLGNGGLLGGVFGGIFGDGSGCTGNLGLNGVLGPIGDIVGGVSVAIVGNTGIDNSGAAVLAPDGSMGLFRGLAGIGGPIGGVIGGSYGSGAGANGVLSGLLLSPGNNPYVTSGGIVAGGTLIFPNQPGWTSGGLNCTPQYTAGGIFIIYPGQSGYYAGCPTCFGSSSSFTSSYGCSTGQCASSQGSTSFKRAINLR